jgi:hypothetical protein
MPSNEARAVNVSNRPRQPNCLHQGRQIHENFHAVHLACRWLHAKRCPTMLLKVDLAKAFDSVAWPFLVEMLERVSFPQRWRDWILVILSMASTKAIHCRRYSLS